MAHRKAGGSAKNLSDSSPQYLGTKLYAGQKAQPGSIIVRQRGTKILAGENVCVGKDHTLYSTANGTITYRTVRKKKFDGTMTQRKMVDVTTA
jgi:large subunit ribosomal protein L27